MGCATSIPAVEGKKPDSDKIVSDKRRGSAGRNGQQINPTGLEIPPPPKRLSMKEMKDATKQFSTSNYMGEGNFGAVYRGSMIDPSAETPAIIAVAIKRLNHFVLDGYKSYLSEVVNLDQLRHPNLIRLVAYSHEKKDACLAYEFCPRGSLEAALASGKFEKFSGHDGGEILPWSVRVSIALGVARGLAVMHEKNIIHRALKSANILLAEDFSAKVTDFALARAGPDGDQKHVSTQVLGNYGYLDPVYVESGRLTLKTDVFSYGVILLELITGRPSISDWIPLVEELKPHLNCSKPSLFSFVDPALKGVFPRVSVQRITLIARACTSLDLSHRPSMNEVASSLEKALR